MITILVIDEFGEGYPVAWCLTSREDQELTSLFFETIKNKSGMVTPQQIMTDNADHFFSSWKTDPQKLLCTWHVDRAWRGALSSKIVDKSQVYHSLRIVTEEPDEPNTDKSGTTTARECRHKVLW